MIDINFDDLVCDDIEQNLGEHHRIVYGKCIVNDELYFKCRHYITSGNGSYTNRFDWIAHGNEVRLYKIKIISNKSDNVVTITDQDCFIINFCKPLILVESVTKYRALIMNILLSCNFSMSAGFNLQCDICYDDWKCYSNIK